MKTKPCASHPWGCDAQGFLVGRPEPSDRWVTYTGEKMEMS